MKLVIILAIFFAGCQKNPKEVAMKDTLKIDFQEGDLTSLHPHELIIYLRGISIGKTLYEGLTRIDEEGKAQLAGAESVDISLDGLFYVFKLRKNHWSDGSSVTASHYEQGWKEALSPLSFCKRSDLLFMIKNSSKAKKGEVSLDQIGVKALDDFTLFVELERPSPHFMELLAQPICAPIKDLKASPIAHFNGPFALDKWERGSLLTLKPNPHFWNRSKVTLPRIEVFMVQDPQTTYALYEEKKLDWIGVPLCPLSTDQIHFLEKKKALHSHPIDRAFWIFLNTQHPSLSSPMIRKALSLAINREAITHNVFIGGDPLDKPLPHALLPTQAHSPIKEDLTLARKFFHEGLKELQLTLENFPPLIITYSQQANRKQLAEYLQQAWSKVFGIEVKLEPQEWNVLRANMGTGQFEITGAFEASYCHDPLELMERMAHLGSANFPQWVSPLYQQKISSASKEPNPEQRTALLSEAEEILLDQMPFIPISSDRFLFAHHPRLKGYAFDSVGAVDFSYASIR